MKLVEWLIYFVRTHNEVLKEVSTSFKISLTKSLRFFQSFVSSYLKSLLAKIPVGIWIYFKLENGNSNGKLNNKSSAQRRFLTPTTFPLFLSLFTDLSLSSSSWASWTPPTIISESGFTSNPSLRCFLVGLSSSRVISEALQVSCFFLWISSYHCWCLVVMRISLWADVGVKRWCKESLVTHSRFSSFFILTSQLSVHTLYPSIEVAYGCSSWCSDIGWQLEALAFLALFNTSKSSCPASTSSRTDSSLYGLLQVCHL